MKLSQLLIDMAEVGDDVDIEGLQLDSRLIQPRHAFIAINGSLHHGLKHAPQAIDNGAVAIIYDPEGVDDITTYLIGTHVAIAIENLSAKLGVIAARFYHYPSKSLRVIGITGTNGKTTCSQLIAQALPGCGVIGTLGWGDADTLRPTLNTTPDALALHAMLHSFLGENKRHVAIEVSSHGLEQGRVNGMSFHGAVFTNLSRDHLDFHGDMTQYLNAKLRLFTTPGLAFAVVNLDDANSDVVLRTISTQTRRWGFSLQGCTKPGVESVVASDIEHRDSGIAFTAQWCDQMARVESPIAGAFNVQNLMTVLCVLLAMDWSMTDAIAKLKCLRSVTGRMQKFGGSGKPSVYVDYAHTPDALEKVLLSAKSNGRLWVVFGCGGDRDKGKRPQMGRIAENLANHVILTDDNPRNENSGAIIGDILAGCQRKDITIINDRKTAISTVIRQAESNDCIVVAGKGHENYQEIGSLKLPFSDQAIVEEALAARGSEV